MNLFSELSLILVLATIFAFISKLLRQPPVVGYLLAGIIIGPSVLNLLHSEETIELFSHLGIAMLLFIVGLHLSPSVLRDVGKASFLGGLGQIIFTFAAAFGLTRLIGLELFPAIYVSAGLTLSSTIIVLKLLSDKNDLNSLYGKLTVGILLVQDLVAILLLMFLPSFSQTGTFAEIFAPLFLKGIIAITTIFIIAKFILPLVSRFAATTSELLFLFSLTWGFSLAAIFQTLGFSVETGALIAGISLSLTPFAHEISSRLRPLRDFFIVLFFILLGSQLTFSNLPALLYPALTLSFFVLFISPLIVLVVLNLIGFNKRVGFLTGLSLAQISEFSLILAQLGLRLGHISSDILSLITLIALITITFSTYLINHSEAIYSVFSKPLSFLEIIKRKRASDTPTETFDTLLFGYHRVGLDFVKAFQKLRRRFLVIDFDPQAIKRLKNKSIPSLYGDAQDAEFLEELNLSETKLVVSTIPDFDTNLFLVEKVIAKNPKAIVIVLSHSIADAKALYQKGAAYVVMPHYLGAKYASSIISRFHTTMSKYATVRKNHLKFLDSRQHNL